VSGETVLFQGAAPWAKTGYGTPMGWLMQRMEQEGYHVFGAALHGLQGEPHEWNGIQIFPSDMAGRSLQHLNRIIKPDLVITHQDIWVMDPNAFSGLRAAAWIPIDTDPLGENDKRVLQASGIRPIAMSRHGFQMLIDEGFEPLYAPHAVDTSVFRPLDGVNPDPDYFTIGLIGTNIDMCRKGITEQMMAFAEFHKHYWDSRLVMHTAPNTPSGNNLRMLIKKLGIEQCVILPEEYEYHAGMYPTEYLVSWYNQCDLITHASYAEGFGICINEAQACGVPVIATAHSAMKEMVPKRNQVGGDRWYANTHAAFWLRPSQPEIVNQYVRFARRTAEEKVADALGVRKHVVEHYDVEHVWKTYWQPTLEELLK
jgi:glycosyltransferase involved in cell wall biosynthesis